MASKVPIKPAAAQAEPEAPTKSMTVPTMGFLPSTCPADDLEAPESGSFLPQLKMVFPIEIRPTGPFKQNHGYTVGLSNSESYEPLEAGYTLSLLDCRNAAREVKTTDEGDGKGKKKEYIRSYGAVVRGGKTFDKTHAAYEHQHAQAMAREPNFEPGVSLVVAVIRADGSVAIAEMPLFKTQRAYWQNHITKASVQHGLGLRVDIDNHFDNVIESKSGDTSYPGPKKFVQFEHVQLTPDQIKAIAAAMESAGEGYMAWLGR